MVSSKKTNKSLPVSTRPSEWDHLNDNHAVINWLLDRWLGSHVATEIIVPNNQKKLKTKGYYDKKVWRAQHNVRFYVRHVSRETKVSVWYDVKEQRIWLTGKNLKRIHDVIKNKNCLPYNTDYSLNTFRMMPKTSELRKITKVAAVPKNKQSQQLSRQRSFQFDDHINMSHFRDVPSINLLLMYMIKKHGNSKYLQCDLSYVYRAIMNRELKTYTVCRMYDMKTQISQAARFFIVHRLFYKDQFGTMCNLSLEFAPLSQECRLIGPRTIYNNKTWTPKITDAVTMKTILADLQNFPIRVGRGYSEDNSKMYFYEQTIINAIANDQKLAEHIVNHCMQLDGIIDFKTIDHRITHATNLLFAMTTTSDCDDIKSTGSYLRAQTFFNTTDGKITISYDKCMADKSPISIDFRTHSLWETLWNITDLDNWQT